MARNMRAMAIDSSLLGETAAKCMESFDENEEFDGGKLIAIGIVAVCENAEEDMTFTRIFCSAERFYEQMGLFSSAIHTLTT